MLTTIRHRMNKEEEGFTLIELMIVVLIIGILLAVAIPSFLGAQNKSKDRSAQSDLRNSLSAAKVLASDSAGVLTGIDATAMGAAEASITFAATGTTDAVGVKTPAAAADPLLLTMQSKSKGNPWFGVKLSPDGEVVKCKTAAEPAADTCTTDAW